jgi:hypothetical protein
MSVRPLVSGTSRRTDEIWHWGSTLILTGRISFWIVSVPCYPSLNMELKLNFCYFHTQALSTLSTERARLGHMTLYIQNNGNTTDPVHMSLLT